MPAYGGSSNNEKRKRLGRVVRQSESEPRDSSTQRQTAYRSSNQQRVARVATLITARSGLTLGKGTVVVYRTVWDDPDWELEEIAGETLEVWNPFSQSVAINRVVVISPINGIWMITAADC